MQHQALLINIRLFMMQDMRKRKAGLEVKERHGQTCVPGALLVRVDTVQAALALVRPLHWYSCCIGSAFALVQPLHWFCPGIGAVLALVDPPSHWRVMWREMQSRLRGRPECCTMSMGLVLTIGLSVGVYHVSRAGCYRATSS